MFYTILIFLIVLALLVFVHEAGHFLVAKKKGVKPEEFGFGFPPRAMGIYKDQNGNWKKVYGNQEVTDASDTIYSVNWIPLGGFVKIKGENGENKEDKDSFGNKSVGTRALILSAGVLMNVVLAGILLSIGFMIGMPQSLDKVNQDQAHIQDRQVQIAQVLSESPAEKAGLERGDMVVSAQGEEVESYQDLKQSTDTSESINLQIKRGDEIITKEITPTYRENLDRPGIGVALAESGVVQYPWYYAIYQGFLSTFQILWAIILALFFLIKGLIVGNQEVAAQVGGPVAIADLTGQYARMGFAYLIKFTSLLSINLAILNFLPLPALDGGRVLFLLIEKIKGKPVKKEVEAGIHNIGFLVLILLLLLVTFKDVKNLLG